MKYSLSVHNCLTGLLLASAMACTTLANADCHVDRTQRVKFLLPDIVVSPATAAGAILAQKTINIDADNSAPFHCSGDGRLAALPKVTKKISKNIYATNVQGIGYRLIMDNASFPWQMPLRCSGPFCNARWPLDPRITLQLVQTSAHLNAGNVIRPGLYGVVQPDNGKPALLITLMGAVHLHQQACDVANSTVNFGDVTGNQAKPGAIIATKPFVLHYQCTLPDSIIARWEGNSTAAGDLALSSGSDARGIAILISNKQHQRIKLNRSFRVKAEAGEIPFQASLLSHGDVIPGNFTAQATFHILYQ